MDHKCCRDKVTPEFVRLLLREPYNQVWPSGLQDVQLLLLYCTSDVSDNNYRRLDGLPLIPLQNGLFGSFAFSAEGWYQCKLHIFIIHQLMKPYLAHHQTSISDGAPPRQLFFIADENDRLLFEKDGEHMLVAPHQWLDPRVVQLLETPALLKTSNVVRFQFQYLDYFLQEVMPNLWMDVDEVMWKPGSIPGQEGMRS